MIPLQKFEITLIRSAFTDPQRFKNNAARSSAIEKGLENAWRCYLFEFPQVITKVENNPVIQTSVTKRRPDIYLEILGNLGAEYCRNVEFQVKAYGDTAFVEYANIQSSLELFNEQYTDFIYFIITGKGLNPEAEKAVRVLEQKYKTRIGRPTLNEHQQNILFFLALYQEIVGKPLGTSEFDLPIAADALRSLLNQDVNLFLREVQTLTYRGNTPSAESEVPVVEIPPPVSKSPIPSKSKISPPSKVPSKPKITSFIPKNQESAPSPAPTKTPVNPDMESSRPEWVAQYPALTAYRHELCALCIYLKDRESGKFRFKFTESTVSKNMIEGNANLDKKQFKLLLKAMENQGLSNLKKLLIC